jgi:hypothetical protein
MTSIWLRYLVVAMSEKRLLLVVLWVPLLALVSVHWAAL